MAQRIPGMACMLVTLLQHIVKVLNVHEMLLHAMGYGQLQSRDCRESCNSHHAHAVAMS